ncbi:TrmB family transcriptional regulator [Brevibacillus choshinensis]|uniref:TrmB family transcriptional regulator n=1 Tax=Brevibacillus choshinensis TaxID=54911 RepID=UPI002E235508|nr:helix-turn-helix domain-containing protein [Brevibacillus choshinensis]MED4782747.1 helix-turn-helix domain-containing protein [Brevibacillus choshinensis]
MSTLWEKLQLFGFNQYEAKAYTALVSLGTSNAYQISKESGIPRARIYDTLETLVTRGLVLLEEAGDGAKCYSPLPVEVFLDQAKRTFEESWSQVGEELRTLEKREPKTDVSLTTVRGEDNVLSFCRIMIRRAKEQVLLSMWEPMYDKLLPELQEKAERGCRVKGILFDVEHPMEGMYKHRTNEYINKMTEERWFVLSVDGKELLYGHSAERKGNAYYTDDPVHIFLLEDYIWHDILVNKLVEAGSQEQLDRWILPEMEHFFGRKMLPESYWKNHEGRKE